MSTRERSVVAPGVIRAEDWHLIGDGRVQCDLCPRACRLAEGQRGFCYVRQALHGEMVLTSYGRASGFCIDPIEKKPLNHFHPGTSVLSFGTAGCNLGCRFCQNWGISKARSADRLADWAPPESVASAARQMGCHSLAFTYNDPVIFAEYAIDCALAAHEAGVRTVAVTAGYIMAGARSRFFGPMDAANVDLKAFSDAFYRRQCIGELAPVLETLEWLHRDTTVWLEVTTLLIPGLNDSAAEIGRLCDWYLDHLGPAVPLHFTAFHPDFKLLDLPPTPPATLRRARRQALAAGLCFVYTGNIRDPAGQTTSCPACDTRLIGRDGYEITDWDLTALGHCPNCGTELAGRFEAAPGHWAPGDNPCIWADDGWRPPTQLSGREMPPRFYRPHRRMPLWLVVVVVAPLFMWLFFRWFERANVYQPTASWWASGADLGRPWEDVRLTTPDGIELSGWFFPAATNPPFGDLAVVISHGNGGNISHRLPLYQLLLDLGLNVLAYDYRGYGRSGGRPDEKGTYLDGEAAFDWLLTRGFAASNVVALGESLGGGIAAELALRRPGLRGLILQSTFTSIPDLGAELFPILPVRMLARMRYDVRERLARIRVPVLILHSRADTLTRFHHAEANLVAAREPKWLREIEGDHNDQPMTSPEVYARAVREFLIATRPRP